MHMVLRWTNINIYLCVPVFIEAEMVMASKCSYSLDGGVSETMFWGWQPDPYTVSFQTCKELVAKSFSNKAALLPHSLYLRIRDSMQTLQETLDEFG